MHEAEEMEGVGIGSRGSTGSTTGPAWELFSHAVKFDAEEFWRSKEYYGSVFPRESSFDAHMFYANLNRIDLGLRASGAPGTEQVFGRVDGIGRGSSSDDGDDVLVEGLRGHRFNRKNTPEVSRGDSSKSGANNFWVGKKYDPGTGGEEMHVAGLSATAVHRPSQPPIYVGVEPSTNERIYHSSQNYAGQVQPRVASERASSKVSESSSGVRYASVWSEVVPAGGKLSRTPNLIFWI